MNKLDVDAVFCISLKERGDRRKAVLEEAKKLNLNIEFVLVEKDNKDPQRGCFNSHKLCSQMALDIGLSRILVLEDDVVFESVSVNKIVRINKYLNTRNPELFYLGAILGKIWLTKNLGIARVRGQGTHAAILSESACKKISELNYDGRGIDSVLTKLFKIYTCFPMLAYQQPVELFPSDLDSFRKHQGKDAKYWSKIKRKQYFSVLRHLHKTLIES